MGCHKAGACIHVHLGVEVVVVVVMWVAAGMWVRHFSAL
jgi:hypothetical protein